MYTLRVYGVDNFGDLDMLGPVQVRTAMRHWVITVAIRHMSNENDDTCLLTEIHYALDHYSNRTFYDYPKEYVQHVVQELVDYYRRFVDYMCKYTIVDYSITTEFHEGVFLVTRD